jgi:hypothetical protein
MGQRQTTLNDSIEWCSALESVELEHNKVELGIVGTGAFSGVIEKWQQPGFPILHANQLARVGAADDFCRR